MKKITPEELEFLKQSNYIENEPSGEALDDAVKAWEYLKKQDNLTLEVILKTHNILMKRRNIPTDQKGFWRNCEVQVGYRLCPAYALVPGLMWHWTFDALRSSPPIDDKWLHIQYEHIHPFIDGNGRTGRMFMNWMRIKKLNKPILIIKEEEKWDYYKWF